MNSLIYVKETGQVVSSFNHIVDELTVSPLYGVMVTEDYLNADDVIISSGRVLPLVQPPVDPLILARIDRNGLLAASDWTQIPDAPLTAKKVKEWKVYRQALRDLPDTQPIVWPDKPE